MSFVIFRALLVLMLTCRCKVRNATDITVRELEIIFLCTWSNINALIPTNQPTNQPTSYSEAQLITLRHTVFSQIVSYSERTVPAIFSLYVFLWIHGQTEFTNEPHTHSHTYVSMYVCFDWFVGDQLLLTDIVNTSMMCLPTGTGGPFPGGKERPGRDAYHSPPI
jgi:hypothetical protein